MLHTNNEFKQVAVMYSRLKGHSTEILFVLYILYFIFYILDLGAWGYTAGPCCGDSPHYNNFILWLSLKLK